MQRVQETLASDGSGFVMADDADRAHVRAGYSAPSRLPVLGRAVFALVAAFPTVTDDATWADVEAGWRGESGHIPLRMTASTYAALSARYGEAAPGVIEVLDPDQIVDALWANRAAWGIVPFDELEPRLKVLYVDGRSPLRRDLDLEAYPLVADIVLSGDLAAAADFQALFDAPYTNRDESHMTILGMTGVTALTRDLAWQMERQGVLWPAEQIRPWLEEVDILHVSNEVSFTPICPPPVLGTGTVVFCADPKYFELLTSVGVDVIENTGNHMNDWGAEPFSYTLDLFHANHIPYYGGGYNAQDAAHTIMIEQNGNRIGFAGCNPNGPDGAWATEDRPGAYRCRTGARIDLEAVRQQLDELRAQNALPVYTIQYWEFYTYEPTFQQADEFRAVAELGAAIVSGSQAHHPQGYDFDAGAVIHWGLGNLFFDQSATAGQRQGILDRYVIYDNRVLSLEVLTFIREHYAQPRPLRPDERAGLLSALFNASGW
jgi:poly-gamma-glutamate synthesis protein (capsule biosynthesis protein)